MITPIIYNHPLALPSSAPSPWCRWIFRIYLLMKIINIMEEIGGNKANSRGDGCMFSRSMWVDGDKIQI